MFANEKENLTEVKNVLVDGGYTGEKFAVQIKELIGAGVEVAKRSELHTFAVIPKRWVVKRSFGWLEKSAGDCGKTANGTLLQACRWLCLRF